MTKIAVTEKEYSKAEPVFRNAEECECLSAPDGEKALAAFNSKHQAGHVIIGVEKYTGLLYSELPRGGVIARFGVGHDGVDKKLATENGLFCTNTPGALDDSVAECAVGLMLSTARHITDCAAENRNGNWRPRVGQELSGKTAAVIGCGNIGRRTAKILRHGFGMKVVGCDNTMPPDTDAFDRITCEFSEAVQEADFVTLHIPDLPQTRNFINAERLALLRPHTVLINTARGGVLDENALYDALRAGKIAAAALDVFKKEPYEPQSPDRDLRKLDNVIMTAHIGSSTREACERMARAAIQNIRDVVKNGKPEKKVWLNPFTQR